MAQRKKKSNGFQNQKIAKAQHRNEFLRKIRHVIDVMYGDDVFPLIPAEIVDKLYNSRARSFKIIVSPHVTVPSIIIKQVKHLI